MKVIIHYFTIVKGPRTRVLPALDASLYPTRKFVNRFLSIKNLIHQLNIPNANVLVVHRMDMSNGQEEDNSGQQRLKS